MLLVRIALIASGGESMRDSWKVLVIVLDVEFWNSLIGECFHVWCKYWVVFRSEDLSWHTDIADLLLSQKRRVRSRDSIDQWIA